jgi:hypothetical protein
VGRDCKRLRVLGLACCATTLERRRCGDETAARTSIDVEIVHWKLLLRPVLLRPLLLLLHVGRVGVTDGS